MKANAKIIGTVVAALGAVIAGGAFSKTKKDEEKTTPVETNTESTTTAETTAETAETPTDVTVE